MISKRQSGLYVAEAEIAVPPFPRQARGFLPGFAAPFQNPFPSVGAAAWSPASIPGLTVGIDVPFMALANNADIASFTDRAGLSFAGSATNKTNVKNGNAAAYFDGAGTQYWDSTSFTFAQPFTLVGVADIEAVSAAYLMLCSGVTGGGWFSVQGLPYWYPTLSSGSSFTTDPEGPSTWTMYTVIVNGASSSITLNAGSAHTGNAGANDWTGGFRVGGYSGGLYWLKGSLGELWGYSGVISDANLTLLKAYLNTRWAIY